MLPQNNIPDTTLAKIIRWGVPLLLLGFGLYHLNFVMAWIATLLENTVKAVFFAALLFAFFFFVVPNWKTISKRITTFIIKLDPLTPMDNYADMLTDKLKNLQKGKVALSGEKKDLERIVKEETEGMAENLRLAKAAKEQGFPKRAISFANEAQAAKQSIALYQPNLQRMERSLKFMDELDENWTLSIDGIRKFNARKRREYKTLQRNAKVLKQSEEFLKGDTEESRRYKQSIEIAEAQMAQFASYIEDFEKRAQPILEGAAIKKKADDNQALDMLEEYMQNGQLFLPNFSEFAEYELLDKPVANIENKPTQFKFNTNK